MWTPFRTRFSVNSLWILLLKTICRYCKRVRERNCSASGRFVIAGDLLESMSRSFGWRLNNWSKRLNGITVSFYLTRSFLLFFFKNILFCKRWKSLLLSRSRKCLTISDKLELKNTSPVRSKIFLSSLNHKAQTIEIARSKHWQVLKYSVHLTKQSNKRWLMKTLTSFF